MKKYILGIMVAVSLTACNSSSSVETEGEGDTTPVIKADTIIKSTVDSVKTIK